MEDDTRNPLQKAIDEIGPYVLARAVNLRGPSVYKWRESGRLPRTEWTGETQYADKIVELMKGRVTRNELLQRPNQPAFMAAGDQV